MGVLAFFDTPLPSFLVESGGVSNNYEYALVIEENLMSQSSRKSWIV